jgi:putative ABC transport system permease protein
MVPLRYNVRSLFVRKITTAATAIGIALVVAVFAAASMLGAGIEKALGSSGRDDYAIVMRDGSDAELSSRVEGSHLGLIRDQPQVNRTGGEAVIGEIVIVITAELADGSGGMTNVLVRGTSPEGIDFRPEVKVVRGRRPQPGTNEVMVGTGIAGRFKGIAVGQQFDLRRNRPLQVVGEFSADGSSYESEVWGDVDVIRTSLGREGMVSSVRVKLANAAAFPAFRAALEADKRLGVQVMRESDFYKKQSEGTSTFLMGMGTIIAILFSLAAMIGCVITMNGAVAHRTREIGTLRALGFSRLAILTSFVFEAIVLALLGGAIGLAFVILVTRFGSFRMMNFATFSEIVFQFVVTPGVIISSLIFAVVMGLIGGLAPAIRASRVSPVEAMRG